MFYVLFIVGNRLQQDTIQSMPVEVIPKFTLYGDNRNAMFAEHPQQPTQPLPMHSQPGQPRHDHDVHQTCAHCPYHGK